MDPVTHTMAGVAIGRAFLRRRLGAESVALAAVASNLPDIDTLVLLTVDPAAVVLRRSFGHSVFFLPLWSLLFALAAKRFCPAQSWKALWLLGLLCSCLHVFLDLVNSFGVLLLWPLSLWRPEFAIIFIIDLILLGIFLTPSLIRRFLRAEADLERLSRRALAGAAIYAAFCWLNRASASSLLKPIAMSGRADFSYVFPEPLGPHRWRGVVREKGVYRLYLINNLTRQVEPRGEIGTELESPLVQQARLSRAGKRLESFFKAPVWLQTSPSQAVAYDLRFRSLLIDRDGVFKYRLTRIADDEFRLERF